MIKSARQSAFEILLRMERDGAYSNLALDSALSEDPGKEEGAFLTALVYGTLERRITLDYNLSLYLRQPLKKLRPEVLTALRLGTYQLLFMDKVPDSAAVNESVRLVKDNNSAYAAGLVNAVLRKVSGNGLQFDDTGDYVRSRSVRFSVPQQIVRLWRDACGERETDLLLEAMSQRAPLYVRVNTAKCDARQLREALLQDGIESREVENVADALELLNPCRLESLGAYREGMFHVQDISSQLCCAAIEPNAGDRIFDMCAAPGGKSFTLAQMAGCKGDILACDIYPSRLELIQNGAKRLGLENITVKKNDAALFNSGLGEADVVLCDVPCSGLGVIRRKPEIRYKSLEDIDKLADMQYDILCCCSKYVKVGGRLLYSTCSINPAENSQVCDRFLNGNKNFKHQTPLPQIKRGLEGEKYLTLMPHIHNSDGFFMALFLRTE